MTTYFQTGHLPPDATQARPPGDICRECKEHEALQPGCSLTWRVTWLSLLLTKKMGERNQVHLESQQRQEALKASLSYKVNSRTASTTQRKRKSVGGGGMWRYGWTKVEGEEPHYTY